MRTARTIGWLLAVAVLLAAGASAAQADVAPGDVIDSTNWQKAEGLLPAPVLAWVKNGDFVLNIGQIDFDPTRIHPDFVLKGFEANRGRYALNEENGIVDTRTGEVASYILGLPFTELNPEDPKVVEKLMYNHEYMQLIYGNFRFSFQLVWANRKRREREVELYWQAAPLTGYPGAKDLPNPDKMEKYAILLVKKPYDVAGTAIMLWRFLHPTQPDNTFGFLPAFRRVRRMSAANRSDTFLGSDESVDDVNGYDGKISDFTWKLLRVQEALIPMLSTEIYPYVQNELGEWQTTRTMKPVIYGYQKEDWKGAAWAPTNLVWVKRPVFVIEMTPKDPFYNYGTHEIWSSPETYATAFKIINDRSGKYWKTLYVINSFCQSADKKMGLIAVAGQNMIDERANHATITENCSPRNPWTMYADVDLNDFSMAGFQKFCK